MQIEAKLRYAAISPQKVRLVADQVRGLSVGAALQILKFSNLKAGKMVKKLLDSAVANAENNFSADVDLLSVFRIVVDQAPVSKRMMPRAKGRSNRILKRSTHVSLVLADSASN